jgi:hypothetical protein
MSYRLFFDAVKPEVPRGKIFLSILLAERDMRTPADLEDGCDKNNTDTIVDLEPV